MTIFRAFTFKQNQWFTRSARPLLVALALLVVPGALMAADSGIPALIGHFSAESSISDRGRLYIWHFDASLAMHETPYFGVAPTLIIAVRTPGSFEVRHLNFLTGEIVDVSDPQPSGDATRHILPTDPDYTDELKSMRDTLQQMVHLDQRNNPLTEAVDYLTKKIGDHSLLETP